MKRTMSTGTENTSSGDSRRGVLHNVQNRSSLQEGFDQSNRTTLKEPQVVDERQPDIVEPPSLDIPALQLVEELGPQSRRC